MDYRLIVGAEQNMPLAPHMVPDMSGDDSWEELPISNRLLLLLRRSPGTRKPIALQVGSTTNRTSCIRRHFKIRLWEQIWEKPKTNAMPVREKVIPPPEVQRNSLLRRTGWSLYRKQHKRSIMRGKKVLPGQTTFAARCRCRIRDSRSCLLHHFRVSHEEISSFKADNFFAGRRAAWLTESSSIPRTTSVVEGSTHLHGWKGGPKRLQTARVVLKLCAHWDNSGGPTVMKSSR